MVKLSDDLHPLRLAFTGQTEMTEEEQRSLAELQSWIRMCNRTVPELRLQIPDFYIPLNFRICIDYYFKCREATLEKEGATKVAELLTSFLEEHPLEWRFSSWKNDLIAKLVLGELNTTLSARKEPGQHWLKTYWKRERRMQREAATYLSPKRRAASSAVQELELLEFIDENPEFWRVPGFRVYATFVKWLNGNWDRLSANKSGPALLKSVIGGFRNRREVVAFSDSELREICDAYGSIESSHPQGRVPPYQVVLTFVARKHKVSARLVTKVRAEINKDRRKLEEHPKARS